MNDENGNDLVITVPTTIDTSNDSADIAATLLPEDEDGNMLLKQTLKRADLKRTTENER